MSADRAPVSQVGAVNPAEAAVRKTALAQWPTGDEILGGPRLRPQRGADAASWRQRRV